ncbi:hypothetical protein B0T21DRAFT_362249 [Apiosordaria backusii]|uniref:3'-5' exonuclease domain-containing protein n=1 Tax=Apiosordaria backusii TaxID=314023 RepID=A0AA40BRT7_9PEZI|nr:hypothetical protein B0T21DRAFT_362249 [Apiosordaria backusii]
MLHFCLRSATSSMNSSSLPGVGPVFRRLVGNRLLYTTTTRHAARQGRMNDTGRQVWDVSKGVVFAGVGKGKKVYYTQLPVRGYTTSPEVRSVEAEGTETKVVVESETFERKVEEGPVVVVEKLEKVVVRTENGEEKTEDGQQKTENEGETTKEDITVLTPPFTPLDFKIPEDIFLAAKTAPEGSPKSFWSYQMYRGPTGKERVKVHYCVSPETTERVIQRYFLNEPVLGFDLEWAPDALPFHGPRRNVSLIQIASPTRIALFHVALYPKKYLNIRPRGIFELSHMYKLVKYCESGEHKLINKKLVSLGKQAEEVLKLPLYKEIDVRQSDWTKSLKLDQIIYSASDAYAGVQIYAMLNHQREQLDPCPPLPHHAELKLPIELPDHTVLPAATEADEIEMTPAEAAEKVTTPKKAKTPTTSKTTTPKTTTPKKEKHPLVVEADLWVAQYRVAHPITEDDISGGQDLRAKRSELRGYYLWHKNPDLDVDAICALLREPPIKTSTLVNYILRTFKKEKELPFDKERLVKVLEMKQQGIPPWEHFRREAVLNELKEETEGVSVQKESRQEDVMQDGPIQDETGRQEETRKEE